MRNEDKWRPLEDNGDFVESFLIAWGLPGAIVGLALLNAGLFFLWRYALSFFFPGA